jgi:hypothetical protein
MEQTRAEEKQKIVREFSDISAMAAVRYMKTMMSTAVTVKAGILSPLKARLSATDVTSGPTIHVHLLTVMMVRPSTSAVKAYLKFLKHSDVLFFSLIAFLLQNNTLKWLILHF